MKYTIILLVCLLFISCSFNKRLYQKGYHIEWRGIKNVSENTSKIFIKRKDTSSQLVSFDKEKLNSLTASTNTKQINANILIQYRKEPKFILPKHLILEGDSVLKQKSNEYLTKKLAKKSFALGITSLICTIGFILYPITVPTAIICGIIAMRKGRKAIAQMGNDAELNKQYRLKAIKGVKLGMSIFVFLITLVHIAMIVGILIGFLSFFFFLTTFNFLTDSVPIYIAVAIILFALGLLAIYGVVRLYLFILKSLFKIIPKKQ